MRLEFIDAVGLGIDTYIPYKDGTLLHGLSFDDILKLDSGRY